MAETPNAYGWEKFFIEGWRWLTRGGATDPLTDPPDVNVSGVVESNLDADNDEVAIFGAEGGGAGTRRIVDVDAAGRVRTNVEDGQDVGLGATSDAAATAGGTGSVNAKARAISRDIGGTTDASVAAGATGTVSSKLRALSEDLGDTTDAAATAGAAGTVNAKLRQATGNLGETTDAAVEGDNTGTISAKLRGNNKVLGATADAAVDSDTTGTVSGKLRGLVKILANVWNSSLGTLKVSQATHDNLNLNANLQVADADVSTSNSVPVSGRAASGSPVSGNPVLVGGQDGTNTRTLYTDSGGRAETVKRTITFGHLDGLTNSVELEVSRDGNGVVQLCYPYVFNGTNWIRTRGSATGLNVIGGLAHDTADTAANSPVKQGYQAIAHGTNPTAVAAGRVTNAYANRAGIPFVIGGHPNVISTEFRATGAQTNAAIASVSAGSKIVVTKLLVTLDEATTVGVSVRIGFATATLPAVPANGSTANGILLVHEGTIPGGGISTGDGSGIIGAGADDEDLRITCEAPTSGDLRVIATYYTVPS